MISAAERISCDDAGFGTEELAGIGPIFSVDVGTVVFRMQPGGVPHITTRKSDPRSLPITHLIA
jgi:hypothetical protein